MHSLVSADVLADTSRDTTATLVAPSDPVQESLKDGRHLCALRFHTELLPHAFRS